LKHNLFPILLAFICIFLTGCLYPEENGIKIYPDEQSVETVQKAVEAYREDNDGVLPLKNKEADTDIYTKYLIDFSRLVPRYLSEIPKNAFEQGGVFQYTIVNAEDAPTVKIFDLRIAEKVREIQLRITMLEYPPFKDMISKDVYSLDFTKIGYENPPTVESPFTGQNLSFVINSNGQIFVDYSSDLYQYLKTMDMPIDSQEDIRSILYSETPFVPAYSLPYTIDEFGEVSFSE
jgi:hypothetical protein